ncbi:hypothetical protein V2J09_016992 [Rumex salicifolius]
MGCYQTPCGSSIRSLTTTHEPSWLFRHEIPIKVVQISGRDKRASLSSALTNLVEHLDSWNKEVFGDMFRSRDRLWKRIDGVQRKMDSNPSRGLLKLESKLRRQLNVILEHIHLFWLQRARSDAMLKSDRNARFFHTCNHSKMAKSNRWAHGWRGELVLELIGTKRYGFRALKMIIF